MKRIEILNCPMDVATMNETVDYIATNIRERTFTQHVVVNVAKIVNLQNDVVLAESIKNCNIVNIDGMGVVFAARLLGYDIPERVSGIDLFYELLTMSAEYSYPVFFLGAESHIVTEVCNRAQRLYPKLKIAGYHHGYFWDNEAAVVEKIRKSGARLLFVAITSPKKENFINCWKEKLSVDFVMGVGGTFDVFAGKVTRAPMWMQKYGLEWLYRLMQEPRRMWKRYLYTNSHFIWLLLKEKMNSYF